ncbi:MAG TPA: cupredoxin domain-containing protein [Micromonosporaceae bacterium]|nr:cupredoxin domain-containing protein [Micromonosporaceae bacterium]
MATQVEPNSSNQSGHAPEPAWREWEDIATDAAKLAQEDRRWHNWMGIAVGLVGLLSITAVILSAFALAASKSGSNASTATGNSSASTAGALGATAAPLAAPQTINVAIKADDEHGRLGPDGKWHDAFLPAEFKVHPGAKVTVTVANYDGGAHTFTSPSLGVNANLPAGSMKQPHQTTFTFTAPKKAGRYAWWCAMPCDPWAMAHNGYMRGYVTVAA